MNDALRKIMPLFMRNALERHPDIHKIVKNTGWLFADKVIRMGVGLFVIIWIARYLGPEQFGIYNYAIAFVALFTPLAMLGLDSIVVRNILREPSAQNEILGSAFTLKLMGGASALFLTLVLILVTRPDDSLMHLLVGIIAVGMVFQAFDVIDFWFQSQVKSRYTVIARNTAFLIISLVKIILIISEATLIAFAWAGVAEVAVGSAGLILAYHANKQRLCLWKIEFNNAKVLLMNGWPLMLAGISIIIYMKINHVMLGEMAGSKAVGFYAAATRISEVWYFIPTTIVSSVFPSLVHLKMKDESLYYGRLQKLFNIMTMLSVSVAIPMTFLSTVVMTQLFGEEFGAAGVVLAIHIWTSVFVFLGVAQSPWDVSESLTKLALLRTMAGAIVTIVLNIVLIPSFAEIGAAVSTVVSQAISAFLLNGAHSRTRIIFRMQIRSFLFLKSMNN